VATPRFFAHNKADSADVCALPEAARWRIFLSESASAEPSLFAGMVLLLLLF
jgi:hypothetical protein